MQLIWWVKAYSGSIMKVLEMDNTRTKDLRTYIENSVPSYKKIKSSFKNDSGEQRIQRSKCEVT